jgi:site-specific DNA-methyltransferase (adenine-specific)
MPPRRVSKPDRTSHQYQAGDCVEYMHWLANRDRDVNMIFADPPFNQNLSYDSYKDRMDHEEYMRWTRRWMTAVKSLLRTDGNFFVSICAKLQADLLMTAKSLGFFWQDTIVWHYTFGPNQRARLTPSWVAIHWLTQTPKIMKWNPETIMVPSARQLKYGDKRANASGKVPDNVWVLMPEQCIDAFRPNCNVMKESRVCGTFGDRVEGHPCQMPVKLMERIVAMGSDPGDVVLDPFCGSGTTSVACKNLGRSSINVDVSEEYIALARRRIGS